MHQNLKHILYSVGGISKMITLNVSKNGLSWSQGISEEVDEPYQATWACGAKEAPSSFRDTVMLSTCKHTTITFLGKWKKYRWKCTMQTLRISNFTRVNKVGVSTPMETCTAMEYKYFQTVFCIQWYFFADANLLLQNKPHYRNNAQ
jgi:hypothetical protein